MKWKSGVGIGSEWKCNGMERNDIVMNRAAMDCDDILKEGYAE